MTVHVYVVGRVNAVEVEEYLLVRPAGGQGELAAVEAHGIVVGHEGRIVRYGIGDVGILGHVVVALHLPVAGHVDRVPLYVLEGIVLLLKSVRPQLGHGREVEVPYAV